MNRPVFSVFNTLTATLTFLVFLFYTEKVFATHIKGAEISYEYIGNTTGVAHQYILELILYADSGALLPTQGIGVKGCSSCYNSISWVLPFVGQVNYNSNGLSTNCSGSNQPTSWKSYAFRDTIVLNGPCADWTFSYFSCCRISQLTNITNSSSVDINVQSKLNNLSGPNNSAQFNYNPLYKVCINQNVTMNHSASDFDQDSLHYSLVSIGAGYQCTRYPVIYEAGYSPTSPLPVYTNQPLQFNAATGLLTVKPQQTGIYQVAVRVDEYRWNNSQMKWDVVGTSLRDFPVRIVATCGSAQQYGTGLDTLSQNVKKIANQYGIQAHCLDTVVTIPYANNILTNTISPDGSDFRMVNEQGAPVPIIWAKPHMPVVSTKFIELSLAYPFTSNGIYNLYTKTGNDGNTIGTDCGFYAAEFDTIPVVVLDCSSFSLSETPNNPEIVVYPNPARDVITLSLQGSEMVMPFKLYDLTGRIVKQGLDNQVGIRALKPGVYFLIINEKTEHQHIFKVLKE